MKKTTSSKASRINFRHVAAILLIIGSPIYAEQPLIVAHRGASQDAPENTLEAFRLAWEQGADAIEGDFHLTKDGQIVCIHDPNTKKIAGKDLVIKESLLRDLRALDVGAYHGERFKGAVIPTIAEVLATVPEQKKIYIEIKSDASIIPHLLREIDKSCLKPEQIVVISFNEQVIQTLEAKAPHYTTFWLCNFEKDESGNITPSIQIALKILNRIKTDGLSSSKNMITESFIKSVMEKGYEYHVWTVDDIKTAERLKNWGAKSITTNRPSYLRKNIRPSRNATSARAHPAERNSTP